MAMPAGEGSLFDDLDAALRSGSSEKRVAMLRRVTDLFLKEADHLNERQIEVFDGVLVQLIDTIEARTLVEISERLAPVANAPIDLALNLARHSEIRVARPILANSSRLTTAELVEIAKTKSQDHLLAISERAQIEPAVTDILVDRGNHAVVHSVAGSPRDDGRLIPCKAADCKWKTVRAILATKLPPASAPAAGRDGLKIDYANLSKSNAQRRLRFLASARS
jgi:uncharacterized protein (DUF2336 family)